MASILLHSILEEINKNAEMGLRESHLPITNELLDSILASFNSDPSTDDFLHNINEVLQIQLVEQDLLLHEVDTFVSEYAKQISPDGASTHGNLPSPVMMHIPSPTPLPVLEHQLIVHQGQQQSALSSSSSMMLGPSTKKRQNFSREITNILMRWLIDHQDHPYPSEQEKAELGHLTGLTMSQISGWFINARRRKLKKNVKSEPADM